MASGLRARMPKIVHRDLKPDNVMVIRDDTVPGGSGSKSWTFASWRRNISKEGAEAVKTRDGVALARPNTWHLSSGFGASKVDSKADVYSLGVVLTKRLPGRPDFHRAKARGCAHFTFTRRRRHFAEKSPDTPKELVS